MDEFPHSPMPQPRKSLPNLLLAGLACLVGSTVFLHSEKDPITTSPTPAGQSAPVTPRLSPTPVDSSSLTEDSENTPQLRSSRILLRQPGQSPNGDLSWHHALKARKIQPKVPPTSPPGLVHRLIVKFTDPLEARASRDGTLTVSAGNSSLVSALSNLTESLELSFRPLQTAPEDSLAALRKRAALQSGQQQPDPSSLVEVVAKDASPATMLAAATALLPLAAVEYAEIESQDAPPPPPAVDISPSTPSLVSYQTYRNPAQGIGVDYVWNTHGIKGHPSLRLTDCEYSYNSSHEDLEGLVTLQSNVTAMFSGYDDDHGTAAIGLIAAGDNGYGMTGNLQNSQVLFYPEYASMDWGTQYRAATVTSAIADSAPGDIVMLEMQSMGPGGGYGPAEISPSVWNAVKMGSDAGVIIIAAAGNGSQNLDSGDWAEYRSRGDSGAIIVGAGYSSRSRIYYSSYGSRVNLQGWGSGVASTGFGSLATYGGDPNQKYTSSFNGTSSATPIVASAAALLQSVSISKRGTRLSPAEMRSLLVASGNPQTGNTGRQIGPLPDLTTAVPQLLASEFSNSTAISIPDIGEASPSPSTIAVSGLSGIPTAVRVRLEGLTHTEPRNLDIFLVSPSGKVAALMSDAGGSRSVSNISLMFDDSALTVIPESSDIFPGKYRPANYRTPVETPPPGTTGPIGDNLNALATDGVNGDWKLYITDDHEGNSGSLASWSVSIDTTPFPSVEFATESQDTFEGGAPVNLTATLSEAVTADVIVPFTLSGSSTTPADFSITANSILIPAGQTSGSATITPVDDAEDEDDETIIATMEPPTNAIPAAVTIHTVTILDNDVTLSVASEFGEPSPGTIGQVFTEGTEITASVSNPDDAGNTRQVCSGWTGTGSVPAEGTSNTTTFVIDQNSSITWNWNTQQHLDIQVSGNGAVNEESGWHPQGTQLPLIATPAPDHHFTEWTVITGTISDGIPTDSQVIVQLDEPASLVANFAIDTHTLNYSSGLNGSLSGVTEQIVDHGSDGTAVEAVADPGYEFVDWSDGSTDNPRSDTAVTMDLELSANFLTIPVGKFLVEVAAESPVENGGSVEFGSRVIGTSPVIQSFTLRNTGEAPLTGIQLSLDGPGSAAFSVDDSSSATDIAPAAETTFTVTFTPPAEGSYSATLSIASSDPNVNPFQLLLSGSGKTPTQAFDEWAVAEGLVNPNPPPTPTTNQSGVSLLLKYAFNVNGTTVPRALTPGSGTTGLPCFSCNQAAPGNTIRLEYIRRKDSGLNYVPLQMQNLGNGPRAPMEGNTTITEIDLDWERVVIEQTIDPLKPRLFFTVEVNLPDFP